MDLVISNNGDPPTLLRNGGGIANHFVNFKLVGSKSNRDAIGARITLKAGGLSQIREVQSGGSYLSQSDLRAHFGLAKAVHIDSVEIRWPSGARQSFQDLEIDKFYLIKEGNETIAFQKFTPPRPALPTSKPQ
jgi:hypothetical protein